MLKKPQAFFRTRCICLLAALQYTRQRFVFSESLQIFARDSRHAKRVLTIVEASICLSVSLSVRHTLRLYQNGASQNHVIDAVAVTKCRLPVKSIKRSIDDSSLNIRYMCFMVNNKLGNNKTAYVCMDKSREPDQKRDRRKNASTKNSRSLLGDGTNISRGRQTCLKQTKLDIGLARASRYFFGQWRKKGQGASVKSHFLLKINTCDSKE